MHAGIAAARATYFPAVVLEGRPKSVEARDYGVSRRWVQKLVARYLAEGEPAFVARPGARIPARSGPARRWRTRS